MRYLIIAFLMPLAGCSISGDNAGDSGAPATATGTGGERSYAVSDFSLIDLRGSDNVDVRVGTGFSVRAEGPSDELDQLRISRDGETLKVGRKSSIGFRWGHRAKVMVFVTLPRLAVASVSGSGNMHIDRIEGTNFTAAVAGSGGLNVAALQVDTAKLSIAGSGDLRAAGSVRTLTMNIAGSGSINAGGLKAQSARVSVVGSGGARAAVTGDAQVSMMGSGDVDLGAGSRCKISKMGSGSVRCGN